MMPSGRAVKSIFSEYRGESASVDTVQGLWDICFEAGAEIRNFDLHKRGGYGSIKISKL